MNKTQISVYNVYLFSLRVQDFPDFQAYQRFGALEQFNATE